MKNSTNETKTVYFETYYGSIPMTPDGRIFSEVAERVRQNFYVVKTNWRGSVPLTKKERNEIKRAQQLHSNGKHKPTQMNKVIRLHAV